MKASAVVAVLGSVMVSMGAKSFEVVSSSSSSSSFVGSACEANCYQRRDPQESLDDCLRLCDPDRRKDQCQADCYNRYRYDPQQRMQECFHQCDS